MRNILTGTPTLEIPSRTPGIASTGVRSNEGPLDGVGIEPFDRFLASNVESDRHDNIASAFAGTCDRHSLALLLGTGRFLEAASIEQRDASAQAIRACLFVRQRDAGLAAAAMPGD